MTAARIAVPTSHDARWPVLLGAGVLGLIGALALPWIETRIGLAADDWSDDSLALARVLAAGGGLAIVIAALAVWRRGSHAAFRVAALAGVVLVWAGLDHVASLDGAVDLEAGGSVAISGRVLAYLAEFLAPGPGAWCTVAAGAIALALGLGPAPVPVVRREVAA